MAFRKLGLIALAGGLLAAPPAFAEDKKDDSGIPGEFTFTLSPTSDHTFRGLSQTRPHQHLQSARRVDSVEDVLKIAGV